jgi:hypothetical protein
VCPQTGFQAFRELLLVVDKFFSISDLKGLIQLFRGVAIGAIPHILLDGTSENSRLLINESDLLMQPCYFNILNVISVNFDRSFIHIIESLDQSNQGGLATARETHKGNGSAGGDFEGSFFEDVDILFGGVSKGNVLNVDLTLDGFGNEGTRFVDLDLGDVINDFEDLFAGSERSICVFEGIPEVEDI